MNYFEYKHYFKALGYCDDTAVYMALDMVKQR